MTHLENIAFSEIDHWQDKITGLARDIWQNPEGPYNEVNACKWTAQLLHDAGFDVQTGVGGIKTAIRASYGSGRPVLGFLGEYDALPQMSQRLATHKEPVTEGEWGHACGHNLLGASCVGAAIGRSQPAPVTPSD